MNRKFREHRCASCDTVVKLVSASSEDPESPEMLLPPAGAYIGVVSDSPDEVLLVVACSALCVDVLLGEHNDAEN